MTATTGSAELLARGFKHAREWGASETVVPMLAAFAKDEITRLAARPAEDTAAPPKPAPDAGQILRSVVDAYDRFEREELQLDDGVEQSIEAARAFLAAPVPSPDGTGEKLADRLQGSIDFSDKFNGIAKINVALLSECVTALRRSPSPAVAAEPVAHRRVRSDGTVTYWETPVPDSTPLYASPTVSGDREAIETVADAIDAARYQHPTRPRARPRPFAEADMSDREYAIRLAKAAILSLLVQPGAWKWFPIEHRPLPSGKYLVGHRGHQEIMHFFGPEHEWVKGTRLGFHRLEKAGWKWCDPAGLFNATHCVLIQLPGESATHSITREAAEAATKRAT